jgi:hypothetical protein
VNPRHFPTLNLFGIANDCEIAKRESPENIGMLALEFVVAFPGNPLTCLGRACELVLRHRTLAERALEQYLAILQRPQVNSFGLSCSLVQNRPALLTVHALLEKQWPQVF